MVANGTKSILIVGVGGQGVILASNIITNLCLRHGYDVKKSEVHGMAKRGGSVYSHLRYGERVLSPTVRIGEARALLALEWAEGLRWLPYLDRKEGTLIIDACRIVPPAACTDRRRDARTAYPGLHVFDLVWRVADLRAVDAISIAKEIGDSRVANTLLLGVLSTVLEFSEDAWVDALSRAVPPKSVAMNLEAFARGRAMSFDVGPGAAEPAGSLAISGGNGGRGAAVEERRCEIEIIDEWCKGCDICVKVCPEHCLGMNRRSVVEVRAPRACTGCGLCEMLCPDFAISIR